MTDDTPADEITLVTMAFDAAEDQGFATLGAILARYVVLTRGAPGNRNVDLCASVTHRHRLVIVEKWGSVAAQRAHMDAPETVEMAQACRGILAAPPEIDLLEGISAHDLA